jgi:hypothetical protein
MYVVICPVILEQQIICTYLITYFLRSPLSFLASSFLIAQIALKRIPGGDCHIKTELDLVFLLHDIE